MSEPVPRYEPGDVLQETAAAHRRLLVLAVGVESYFVRRLDAAPGGPEPLESAWAFEGCEGATRLASPAVEP
ncbi:hypothetical protein ACFVFS_34510 [Kitasatospora sp. NPDC057692]|uniref:hypothetical protein n=1 Tax=Kitasatospora sp. NPDC057692 TaxID=3346215 RepID=UPI0036750E25